ncbi:ROK family protein [Spiroplasma endosymbiont of Othius punctulatus]|uniref:ROK family protein n=1 Tax=Spiroplasma endosymbiont of Othius punctulatus TaxID=3066289 RepID=UPI0030D3AEC3
MKSLCIDLGGTTAKCVIFVKDEIVDRFQIKTGKNKNVLQEIKDGSEVKLKEHNMTLEELDFVGIAIAGLLNMNNGVVLIATNLGWKNYPLLEEAKKIFNKEKVFVLNDASSATYGEWSIGLKGESSSMALYTIGTGIGGGIIYNNKLVVGDNTGLASEPGHGGGFQNEKQCTCGAEGCVDLISSARGIEREINRVAKISKGPLNKLYLAEGERHLKVIDIVELFNNKDKEIIDIFNSRLEPLAKSMAVTIHTLDVKTIVISGGVSNLGQPLLDIIQKQLERFTIPLFLENLKLRTSSLKSWVGAKGIYEYGKDNFDSVE